ncbi:3-ketosteroid 9alpha-monooxygenase subunit B [Nocardia tenerifensis]|uniref:3-ketosteroid 9alpha-monooxygenase subunit B n=1 Tax=Nocardia tenerifensis TaxID=228006 RepID=A0A318KEC8_9NOCA|nr:ferredoxin--NADP reductase [Nocardia tenerifensis]PXX70643.1 3-ketosteroid 9alpha-monooxygenase subunit B [Nocardia tenerifensis]
MNADNGVRVHVLKVGAVIEETAEARTLVFEVPDELSARFRYRPGQFLTVRVPSARTGSVARCYSLCSSPHCDDRIAVTVKRIAGGYASNLLCDTVAVGDLITVLEPSGSFGPRGLDADVVLCAAGSGITPILSIVKSMMAGGRGNAVVLYANRDRESVIFADPLAEWTRRYPDRLRVLHWLDAERGLATTQAVTQLLRPYSGRDWFLCGPSGFLAVVGEAAAALRVPAARLHREEYRSLRSNPFDEPERVEAEPLGDATVAEVEIDGRTHVLDWPRRMPLLDVLLDNGIDAPYVCRESACGTCVCSVRQGRTRMRQNEALLDEEIALGLTLACQTLPESSRVRIVFDQ